MKHLVSLEVSLYIDDQNEEVQAGYAQKLTEGLSETEVDKHMTDMFISSINELMEEEVNNDFLSVVISVQGEEDEQN